MKYLLTLFLALSSFFLAAAAPVELVVVITSYNNEKWVFDNLSSVVNQTYPYYKVIYVNDCSKDRTAEFVDQFVTSRKLQSKVTVIHNKERKGALQNLYETIHQIEPQKVVVTIDGDDTLTTSTALETVAEAYKSPRIWMTYGNFKTNNPKWTSNCARIPRRVSRENAFRSKPFVASHLRTFYAKLFQKIKKEDLLYKGKFFPMTWDMAMMFPMLEMAAKRHFRFIKEEIYLYNVVNPLNDYRVNAQLQRDLDAYIRNMPRYTPLGTLF